MYYTVRLPLQNARAKARTDPHHESRYAALIVDQSEITVQIIPPNPIERARTIVQHAEPIIAQKTTLMSSKIHAQHCPFEKVKCVSSRQNPMTNNHILLY